MSNEAFFISDLHFGHKNILNFEPFLRNGKDVDEHNLWLVQQWNSRVNHRDVVYVLGDVVFGVDNFRWLGLLNGKKKLLMGNHDTYALQNYLPFFDRILPGLCGYKGYWLSHAPMHPDELRGRKNVHGHVHRNSITDRLWAGKIDKRYINVCVEMSAGVPVSFDELEEHQKTMQEVMDRCAADKAMEMLNYKLDSKR